MRRMVAALISLSIAGVTFSPSLVSGQTLNVGYTSKTIFFLPFFVGQKKGFFDAENLKVELIHMGTPAISLQALIAGQIQVSNINPDGIIIVNEKGGNLKAIAAAVLGIPQSDIAIERGFNNLGEVLDVLPSFQFTTVNVNPAWAEKNRPIVVRFLKAHIRSLNWIHDHLDEASELFSRETGVKSPYARKGVAYFTKNRLFPKDGNITMEGMKVNIEVQARDGLISPPLPPPEKNLDLSYLRQAQKELGN